MTNVSLAQKATFYQRFIEPPVAAMHNQLYTPMLSAYVGIAILTPFYQIKNALQLGNPPTFKLTSYLSNSGRGGLLVGAQAIIQNVLKAQYKTIFKKEKLSLGDEVVCCAGTAFVSAPFLAAYNKMTSGSYSVGQSFSGLSWKQIRIITFRETIFLFPLLAGPSISDLFQSPLAKVSVLGMSGAVGSAITHPLDTQLTLAQHKKEAASFAELWKGGGPRILGISLLVIAYNKMHAAMKDAL